MPLKNSLIVLSVIGNMAAQQPNDLIASTQPPGLRGYEWPIRKLIMQQQLVLKAGDR